MGGSPWYSRPAHYRHQSLHGLSRLSHSSTHFFPSQYTNNFRRGDNTLKQKVNYTGNNIKSLMLSVENSLKRFRTNYIDILYVHYWDNTTDVEEIMDGLHNLIVSGKVLYLVRLLP